ncbi:MAG: sigma factor-like helix-turn-helix DNA-binding protein, partial [Planctomycetota bacterium]
SFALQDPSPGDSSDMGRISLREESDAAEQAMAMLSAEQQRVLRLSVVYGLSHEKIAQATDMPLGTVKTHIRRGLIKVRDVLRSQRNGANGSTGQGDGNGADRGVTQ